MELEKTIEQSGEYYSTVISLYNHEMTTHLCPLLTGPTLIAVCST